MKTPWYRLNEKVNSILGKFSQAGAITVIPASTNLPTVGATFADLAAARAAVEAQRAGAEPRLDALETKVNEIITKLKASGVIA